MKRFYLGTHQPYWMNKIELSRTPLFVSRRRLVGMKTLPRAQMRWALDSGGFVELSMHEGWQTPIRQFVAEVRRIYDEVGNMDWAAPQDWMCEPVMLRKTGLTVREHQRRTVWNYVGLRDIAPDIPFIPVLQGWTANDYRRHIDEYDSAGIDLSKCITVGLGTVCRRQNTDDIETIVKVVRGVGRLHGFGVKSQGIARIGKLLYSSDSMAWSFTARRAPPLDGCTHRNCANCINYALQWRRKLMKEIP